MAGQPEVNVYDASVYQWERVDPVEGAIGGIANAPLLNLANRTNWLKHRVDALIAAIALLAPINSPNFTGSASSPNVADGDDSTLIANTHFVQRRDHGYMAVTTTGGNTVLTQPLWGVGMILVQGALTSNANIVFPATATGKWMVWNQTTGAFRVFLTVLGQIAANGISLVQSNGALVWSDGVTMRRQDNQLTATGEVLSTDLATTGVGAGAYNKANLTVGVDGRITSASNGVVTFADVVGGLGFTPVQQGGGFLQQNNKVYIGWDGNHLRASVDVTDQGRFAMIKEFLVQSVGLDIFRMDFPSGSTASGNMFLQMFGGGANTVGSGSPESTIVTMPWTFPNAILGAVGCYLGTTPPLNSPLAVYPYSSSQVQLTVSSNSPANLGCVVLAFGF